MVDGKDSKTEMIVPSEPTPIVDGVQTYHHTESRWLHLLLYIVTALIFAFFLVLAGRGIYHKVHHNKSATVTTSPATKTLTSSDKNSSAGKSQVNKSSNPPSTSPSSTPSPQLPNSGPGNILVVFVGTSLAVGGLHFVLSLRKIS